MELVELPFNWVIIVNLVYFAFLEKEWEEAKEKEKPGDGPVEVGEPSAKKANLVNPNRIVNSIFVSPSSLPPPPPVSYTHLTLPTKLEV